MKTFLESVADDLLSKFGTNLADVAVVFPNKRAALFLNEHLARKADKPILSPAYITISELFRQQSDLSVGDQIKLICDLHKSFTKVTGINETLDHFFSWGQLLLSDFDDIDKNMGDVKQIFSNIGNLHEFDDTEYLSDNQKKALKSFFSTFNEEHESELRQRFLQLWSRFAEIYNDYREQLKKQNIAYEGMLYREVTDKGTFSLPYKKYVFVGFNMLQQVEQKVFSILKKEMKAMFYWDFDSYYMDDNEAGHFIKEYLEKFPNELNNRDEKIYSNLNKPKEITYISSHTEDLQARYISQWICERNRASNGRKTAIVMCDESLLTTVVHSLPENIRDVNITTGYPLKQTPVATTIIQGLKDKNVKEIIKNLLDSRKEITKDESDIKDPLEAEALFRAYTILNRIDKLIDDGDLVVDRITLQRLVSQIIGSTMIPYHGEPVKGIQIMGILETRNLDFEHVILLSCNEGNMPKGLNDSSFIPHSIRKAFGLTTIDHKASIYSYYFHRLLQRASDVTILYNNSTEDGHTGEMSRFMLQLLVESSLDIKQCSLVAGQSQQFALPSAIVKDKKVMKVLNAKTCIYPTSINRYLRCPLQFYFRDICGLDELEDEEEGTIDNRIFGNIFHRASEHLYQELKALTNHEYFTVNDLELFNKHPEIAIRCVDKAIREELFDNAEKIPQLNGIQTINREVIIHYINRLIEIDKKLAPFRIIGTEQKVEKKLTIKTRQGDKELNIGGFIDRLDQITDNDTGEIKIRVVDYKTGSKKFRNDIKSIDEIFIPDMIREKHSDYYLQTMLYSLVVRNSREWNKDNLSVSPALLFIQHTAGDKYSPTLIIDKKTIDDIREYEESFMEGLLKVLSEIYDTEVSFYPTEDRKNCSLCPYRQLCFSPRRHSL